MCLGGRRYQSLHFSKTYWATSVPKTYNLDSCFLILGITPGVFIKELIRKLGLADGKQLFHAKGESKGPNIYAEIMKNFWKLRFILIHPNLGKKIMFSNFWQRLELEEKPLLNLSPDKVELCFLYVRMLIVGLCCLPNSEPVYLF